MVDGSTPPRFDRWSGNLLDGQLVIRTLLGREFEEHPDSTNCGSEFGYWICRFRLADRSYEPIAKFVTQEHVELFAAALDMPVVYWPEGD